MSDILMFVLSTMIAYIISLAGMEYVHSKPKRTRYILIAVIVVAFSLYNGWAMKVNEDRVSIETVEKLWKEYTIYCKEERISWSEITFPEWLSLEAGSYFPDYEGQDWYR